MTGSQDAESGNADRATTDTAQGFMFEPDADVLLDLNFEDIDWSFWNNFD